MKIKLNHGHIAALALTLALIIWMVIGAFSPKPEFSNPRPLALSSGLTKVQVERLKGELSAQDLAFSGVTSANRQVELRSETQSLVRAIHKPKGSTVKAGELILELDQRDWPARLAQAAANLKQREIEARSAKELAAKGLTNDAQLAQAQTLLANAKAEHTRAQIQLDATQIRAPFAGIVDNRFVEVGDYVQNGTPLAQVLDFSPWLVKGQVSERDANAVRQGSKAFAILSSGERLEGVIRFVASASDPKTRTFAVEMEIKSSKAPIASGLTARIHVPQSEQFAYYLSPALLVLNDQGHLGLKGVNEADKVIFVPVELLGADDKGVWVSGPSPETRVITLGQGFVEYGQKVQPVTPQSQADSTSRTASSLE